MAPGEPREIVPSSTSSTGEARFGAVVYAGDVPKFELSY